MPKSSDAEDPSSSSGSDNTTVKKPNKLSFKSLLSSVFSPKKSNKEESAFHATIKQLKSSTKTMTAEEKEILTNFLKFGSKTVEQVMIPRSDISAVKQNATLDELNLALMTYSHTRTLVYADNLDNIIGFIHIKDLFKVMAKKQDFQLKKLIRKPIISAPSMKLIDLLVEMQRKRTHISVVVDEYGGTDGIVTIEDIMEEIVGRIDDEHDEKLESDSYKIISANTIIASARVEVEDLEKILGVKLKEDDDEFDTIGGLVLAKVGHVPLPGTKIEIASANVEIEVIDAGPRGLKQVKLTLKE